MGTAVLILGESGTGKTTSLRNLTADDVSIVNVAGKQLPFRGKFEMLSNTTDADAIKKFMRGTDKKRIVVDDCQYIMSFQYMRRIKENGWDKFNEIQSDFFSLIEYVKELPDDVIVYFMSHLQTCEDGRQKIKTIGKMLDEKITIEGMFTIVLKTYVADGKYYFLTQNSGKDTTKSPMGMFPSLAIANDLKYVDEKIRNYYQFDDCKSDEQMAEADEIVKTKIETAGRKPRVQRAARPAAPAAQAADVTPASEEQLEGQMPFDEVKPEEISDNDLPFTMNETQEEFEPRQRRTRKVRE